MSSAVPSSGLRVLVVDDEAPALDELAWLLSHDDRVAEVLTSNSATDSLRLLRETDVDCVFLDIQMPGLTGLELADVLARFRTPPPIVFVTAHENHAVDAFEVRAVDYVLKPVRAERLAEAVRRVVDRAQNTTLHSAGPAQAGEETASATGHDLQIPVELGGVTRFVERASVTHVEAHGDYARLHTPSGSHLIRVPLSTLEEEWRDAGFLRIHRSMLVNLGHVVQVRMDGGRCSVVVGPADGATPGAAPRTELVVSRRNTRELRELLVKRALP
ncbi:LytTR family DNA-binding domain-containing protein [Nocardioides sp. R-C-SC26]|uniref:LytR/AlgR family response regulator transcription factor n=1 Tax=Nocardioides sp. R-C-SC26 TaxID=2870414 RepID=UPI001E40D60E|nr:LytTR family DNA-binding domain-containing protein [Nocardioides sp. R-C-SC26]